MCKRVNFKLQHLSFNFRTEVVIARTGTTPPTTAPATPRGPSCPTTRSACARPSSYTAPRASSRASRKPARHASGAPRPHPILTAQRSPASTRVALPGRRRLRRASCYCTPPLLRLGHRCTLTLAAVASGPCALGLLPNCLHNRFIDHTQPRGSGSRVQGLAG